MRHNIFEFGDTYWFQRTGCAMGTPPACSYATLYFSDHESKAITMFPELIFQKRFIDDLFGIWVPASQQQINHPTDSQRWQLYQQYMNQCGILRWEFSTRQKSVDYLDLTIAINKDGTIRTSLFEKTMNLYLYLPPSSSHPISLIKGFIYGLVLRIYRLTSHSTDISDNINKLFKRLVARGYKPDFLTPLFQKAATTIKTTTRNLQTTALTIPNNNNTTSVFLHLEYHPKNPTSKQIQQLFHTHLYQPISATDNLPLPEIRNNKGIENGIQRLIVGYSRPFNIGNLLSSRIIDETSGLPVSVFL